MSSHDSSSGGRLRPLFFDSGRVVVRQETARGVVGGGGELREHPVEVGLGVELQQLAGADDGVDDAGDPAGVRVAHEEPVFATKGGGPDVTLDGIVVDLNVAQAGLRIAREFAPAAERVGAGLAEVALGERGDAFLAQALVQPVEDQRAARVTELSALGVAQSAVLRVPLDLVEALDIGEQRDDALTGVAHFDGAAHVAPGVRPARQVRYSRPLLGERRVGFPAVRLQDAGPVGGEEARGTVSTARPTKIEDRRVRGGAVIGPQPRRSRSPGALVIEHVHRGLIGLDVTGVTDALRAQFPDGVLLFLEPLGEGWGGEIGQGHIVAPEHDGYSGVCQYILLTINVINRRSMTMPTAPRADFVAGKERLERRHVDDRSLLRPKKRPAVQLLHGDHFARAVPVIGLDPGVRAIGEHEQVTRLRVGLQLALHQGGESVEPSQRCTTILGVAVSMAQARSAVASWASQVGSVPAVTSRRVPFARRMVTAPGDTAAFAASAASTIGCGTSVKVRGSAPAGPRPGLRHTANVVSARPSSRQNSAGLFPLSSNKRTHSARSSGVVLIRTRDLAAAAFATPTGVTEFSIHHVYQL